jgi:hypothetical protein
MNKGFWMLGNFVYQFFKKVYLGRQGEFEPPEHPPWIMEGMYWNGNILVCGCPAWRK